MNYKLLLVVLFRLVNAWTVRTFFAPDEYWQGIEPAYLMATSTIQTAQSPEQIEPLKSFRTLSWEWDPKFALRTTFPLS